MGAFDNVMFKSAEPETPVDYVEYDDADIPEADNGHVVPDHNASSDEPTSFGRLWKPPTKAPRAPRVPKLKSAAPPMPRGGLAKPLSDIYIMLGALLSPMDPVCGGAIIAAAPDCGKSLEALAKTNPEVRRVLVGLVAGSAWGAVITAHIPIVMAVGIHHLPALQPKTVYVPGPQHSEPVFPVDESPRSAV